MNPKAVIAMSGGVDSSVAAALMLEQGYECIGITLKLYKGESRCCSLQDVNDARAVAFRLGMPHYVLNFTDDFDEQVIRRFIETYEKGATPNPCIDCNRYIKFNLLLLRARQLDFDCLATGHYARVERDSISGRFLLRKSVDTKKDQSYVLYCLTQDQLERARFPLGELSKPEVRKIAEEKNLVNAAKGESQDICFVPDGDYGNFIEGYTGKTYPAGDIIGLDGTVLGKHRGLIRYTIGQRRGLGVAANEPVYVAAKSVADNTVTLGPDSSLYSKNLVANSINLIACAKLEKPMQVMVKTRYLQIEQPAIVEQTGEDTLHIEFEKPQRAITPGQAAVLYDGDIVVGGGTIA
ncbi:tRNA-specific 2-thiouridylase MnmA [Spirochaetia bacterium]|nr:tRNA-specific 2-thiouridylase MnmA [Spirochaetia bacterium]